MPLTLHPHSTAATPAELTAALAAPVADPLWMIARQWQTGAFVADDGGDPIHLDVTVSTAPMILRGGQSLSQRNVEADPPVTTTAMDTAGRVRWAAELFRFMADQEMTATRIKAVRAALAGAYPLHPVNAQSAVQPHARRLPDAAALVDILSAALTTDGTGGPLPDLTGVVLTTDPQVEPAIRAWYAWTVTQTAAAHADDDSAPALWDTPQLGYQAAATSALTAGTLQLQLNSYDGQGLEWYALDRETLPAGSSPTTATAKRIRPAPVTFPGMPEPRFWAFERGDVNLDMLAGREPAQALLATFAHAYSNDWFVVPVDVEAGCTTVDSVVVTDTFGDDTAVGPAVAGDPPTGGWRMWDITPTTSTAGDGALGVRAFFTPQARPLEGPATENLLIGRDELANLGWLIELTTRDDDGDAVDRNRRWLQLRPATDPTFNPARGQDMATYRLGTSLPDYWYPLLTGPAGSDQLGLATIPPGASDVSDDGVAGHLVAHSAGTRLADQEASRTGTRVVRVNRLTRTAGERLAWRARARRPGTGEASSGLRFDTIGNPAPAPNLAPNSDFSRALRRPPGPLTIGSAGGAAAVESWEIWNNPFTTSTSWVEPTTRPGGTGWMVHLTTGAGGCGLAQQWSASGTGPTVAHADAWVLVLRGSVTLGSGNGGSTAPDTTSTLTGQWEHLQAPSGGSPVNEVILYAVPPDGAEFLVDMINVRPG